MAKPKKTDKNLEAVIINARLLGSLNSDELAYVAEHLDSPDKDVAYAMLAVHAADAIKTDVAAAKNDYIKQLLAYYTKNSYFFEKRGRKSEK